MSFAPLASPAATGCKSDEDLRTTFEHSCEIHADASNLALPAYSQLLVLGVLLSTCAVPVQARRHRLIAKRCADCADMFSDTPRLAALRSAIHPTHDDLYRAGCYMLAQDASACIERSLKLQVCGELAGDGPAFCPRGSTKVCRVHASRSSADSCQDVSPCSVCIVRWFHVVKLCAAGASLMRPKSCEHSTGQQL